MTRQEFIDSVETYPALMEVAEEANYCFDDVYDCEAYDDYVYETARDLGGDWTDIRDFLDSLPEGYDYYIRDDYDGWSGYYDDDIDYLKGVFLDWADENEWFDPEETEEEEEKPEKESQEEQLPELTLEDFLAFAMGKA